MNNAKKIEETSRKQLGFIVFSNGSYPVYEGLNIVGRDPKATVRVKDLTFSKQHAVISIIDESTHLISDFGSSNGTEIDGKKLIPLKFYKLDDLEAITFGDIVGMYHKGTSPSYNNVKNSAASQFNDAVDTQLLTQNLHDLPTQNIIISNIHEAETQPFFKTNDSQTKDSHGTLDVKINDKTTQLCENTDYNVPRSEMFDDLFVDESFKASTESSKYDIVVDETLPTDSKLNKMDDDEDIILSTQDNAIIELQTQQFRRKSELIKNEDDSATDIEDEEELVKKVQEKQMKTDSDSDTDLDEEFLKLKTQEILKNKNSRPESGSDTDVDENILKNKLEKQQKDVSDTEEDKLMADMSSQVEEVSRSKNKEDISDAEDEIDLCSTQQEFDEKINDSNDDIILAVPTQIVENKNQNDDDLAPTQLLSSIELKEQINKNDVKSSSNHENLQENDDFAPTQLLSNKIDDLRSSSRKNKQEIDDDFLAPTQVLTNKNDDLKSSRKNIQETDDDFLAPTQKLSNKNDDLKSSNRKNILETDDDFLAPTQVLCNKNDLKSSSRKNILETDDDFLAPTQVLCNRNDDLKSSNRKNILETDDDYLAPTQVLSGEQIEKQIIEKSVEKILANNNDLATKFIENDEKEIIDIHELDTELLEPKTVNESIFSAPTQLLEKNQISPLKKSSILKIKQENIDDNDELPATQLLQPNTSNEAPTQILEKKHKKLSILSTNNDDDDELPATQLLDPKTSIYSEPTQVLDKNFVFSAPTQKISEINKMSLLKKSSILSLKSPNRSKKTVNFSEDISDAPTQLLETTKIDKNNKENVENIFENPTQIMDKNIHDNSTLPNIKLMTEINYSQTSENSFRLVLSEDESIKSNSKELETQLEVDFALETQKLYAEEKTSRPNNPLAHMFDDEPTQMTETEISTKELKNIETNRRLQVKLQNLKDLKDATTSKEENDFKNETKKGRPKKKEKMENKNKLNVIKVTNKLKEELAEKFGQKENEISGNLKKSKEENKEERSSEINEDKLNTRGGRLRKKETEKEKEKNKDEEERSSGMKEDKALNLKGGKLRKKETEIESKKENEDKEERSSEMAKGGRLKKKETEKKTKENEDKKERSSEMDEDKSLDTKGGRLRKKETEKEMKEENENKEERSSETDEDKPLNTKGGRLRKKETREENEDKAERSSEMDEDKPLNTRGGRLRKKETKEENEDKEERSSKMDEDKPLDTRGGRLKKKETEKETKEKQKGNTPKLIVVITKVKDDNKNEKKEETSSEADKDSAHNTRGKRISYLQLNSGKKENKRTPKSKQNKPEPAEKTDNLVVKKPLRTYERKTNNKQTPKAETISNIESNSSDFDDFLNRVTRSKRGHSVTETPKKTKDSDESDEDITPKKKKVLKLEYTQEDSATKSKRNLKIEEYSSDENNKTAAVCSPSKRRKYEPLSVTLNSSENNSGDSVRHKIVFTMINDTENLENSIKKLGGSIIDNIESGTILVTNKITRSLKFLKAIALAKPIVSPKWIEESAKKYSFLDPWDYLLTDTESETKFEMCLKDSLKKSAEKKLLAGVTVLIAAQKNHEVLKEIVQTSGAKVISRAPSKNTKAIVVSYEEEKIKYSKYLFQKNLTVVSAEAIFSGVLKQELDWEKHLLS